MVLPSFIFFSFFLFCFSLPQFHSLHYLIDFSHFDQSLSYYRMPHPVINNLNKFNLVFYLINIIIILEINKSSTDFSRRENSIFYFP